MKKIVFAALLASTASLANATPSFTFIIDGDTFFDPFSFTNTSDDGEELVRFFMDISGGIGNGGAVGGLCFDLTGDGVCGAPGGRAFEPQGTSAADTGFVGPAIVVDGGSTLDLASFNDFQPGETFAFDIDVDDDNGFATALGSQLIGASAFADFSDGQRVFGTFAAIPGNPDASGFTTQGIIATPAIPLPAPIALLGSAIGLLGAVRLRRKA